MLKKNNDDQEKYPDWKLNFMTLRNKTFGSIDDFKEEKNNRKSRLKKHKKSIDLKEK